MAHKIEDFQHLPAGTPILVAHAGAGGERTAHRRFTLIKVTEKTLILRTRSGGWHIVNHEATTHKITAHP